MVTPCDPGATVRTTQIFQRKHLAAKIPFCWIRVLSLKLWYIFFFPVADKNSRRNRAHKTEKKPLPENQEHFKFLKKVRKRINDEDKELKVLLFMFNFDFVKCPAGWMNTSFMSEIGNKNNLSQIKSCIFINHWLFGI